MKFNIYALLIIVVGSINIYYCIRNLKDQKFAEKYIRNSHKAFLLRKIFGEEKAIHIIRKIFVPLGIIIGVLLILSGVLWIIFT